MMGLIENRLQRVALVVALGAVSLMGLPRTASAAYLHGGGGARAVGSYGHGCRHSQDAGVLGVDGCDYRIRARGAYRRMARVFRRAGYRAYVRHRCGARVVRVYGCPDFHWHPNQYDARVYRYRGFIEISLTYSEY